MFFLTAFTSSIQLIYIGFQKVAISLNCIIHDQANLPYRDLSVSEKKKTSYPPTKEACGVRGKKMSSAHHTL